MIGFFSIMSILKNKAFQWTAILLLTLGLLYFFFRSVDFGDVLRNITNVKLPYFILMILLIPMHLLTRSIRWKYLLQHEKADVSLYNRFSANSVGFTVSLVFPGRLGELAKPLYLARKENMSKGFVIGTVVVERIFDIFTMCFLLGLFLAAKPLYASFFRIDENISEKLKFWGIFGAVFSISLLLVTLSLYFFKGKTLSVMRWVMRPLPEKFSGKILELVEEFIQGLKFFHSIGHMLKFLAWSFIVWLGIIFYYWVAFLAYDIQQPYFLLFPFTFMLMVGASIPTPGMVGGFHYFSKLGLTSLYGVDPNLATSITLVIHSFQVVMTCLIGYVILSREGLSLFQVSKIGEESGS